MNANADRLDEALLSNSFAWLRKASEDKLDGELGRGTGVVTGVGGVEGKM